MDWTDWRAAQETVRVTVPDEPETHEFDAVYREIGSGDPVTLFVHGLPTWGFLWREITDVVDHAIIPDLPGFGFTRHVSSQPSYSRSVRFLELFLRAFLDELDVGPVDVVSHDWGGAAITRLAIHEPDRFDRIVLSQITCYDNFPLDNIHRLGLPRSASEDKHLWRNVTWEALEDELNFIFANSTYDPDRATNEFVDGMKAPWLERDDPTALHKAAASANANNTLEIAHKLHEITHNTLLLWAEDDLIIPPEWADRLLDDLPNAEAIFYDQAYHWLMQDRPDTFRDALAGFLRA